MNVDGDLVERARGGGDAIEALIEAVWPEAYRVARTILGDMGHAEDAAQEACARMARSLSELRDAGAFRTWMYRIVVNEALAVVRARRPALPLDDVAESGVAFDRSDALDLHAALASLPAARRAVVVLRYHCGFSSREIAAAMGLAAPTVRFHLMMARRALRRALSPHAARLRVKEVRSDAR